MPALALKPGSSATNVGDFLERIPEGIGAWEMTADLP
jgi:hypothetical protein